MNTNTPFTPKALDEMMSNSMVGHLGIKITKVEAEQILATMPVDQRTMQPFKLLHGGASLALGETLGSLASYVFTKGEKQVLGTDVYAQHVRSTTGPIVTANTQPLYLGKRRHIWEVRVYDHKQTLLSIIRVTNRILDLTTTS